MEIIDQTAKVVMLKGEGGDTIKSIDKTTTQGLVDIYTITLESGNKTTFNVNNGNGIKTIEKTSTSGLVDTYTVTFDNGETTTFTVTNGKKGEKGDKGDTGPQGPKGEKGDPGDGGGIANVDTELSTTSTNPVQNKAIAEGINSIQSQIVPTASIEIGETASKAYSVGDFLVKDGILYKVTTDIAKDDALTAGTNIAMTTVGSELSGKSNLTDRVQLSLDAVAVGKDEDGNTIYEKTFKGSTISSGTVVDSNLTISKLKWIRLVGGCFNYDNSSLMVLPYDATTSGTRYKFQIFSNDKGLCAEYVNTNVKMYHFTVQYVLK